ncbi:hypothetical protein Tco_1149372, partial [Tanacetum coccineum]
KASQLLAMASKDSRQRHQDSYDNKLKLNISLTIMRVENSNQPCTLGDYSRPSHEGYRNAIELPKRAKVSSLRSDTIRLVQNGCAFHRLIYTTQIAIDYAAGGRLRKLRSEEAWETIEDLAQHEEEEWNDPIFFEKESPDYIDATLEQELEKVWSVE